jgi:hypothetical protein
VEDTVLIAILAIVLLVLFLAVSRWQSAKRLSKDEVDHYIRILEEKSPQELEDRAEFISRLRAWGESDDGRPIYMLNLMRFYDHIKSFPGGPATGTPQEANKHYEDVATRMLIRSGGYPMIAGRTTRIREGEKPESNLMVYQGGLDAWDRVLVVRYPGRRTFLQLVTNDEYLKVMPYKLASLEVMLTPVYGELVIPDVRWIAGGAFLAIFLSAGWLLAL